jgi:hypothetical protein
MLSFALATAAHAGSIDRDEAPLIELADDLSVLADRCEATLGSAPICRRTAFVASVADREAPTILHLTGLMNVARVASAYAEARGEPVSGNVPTENACEAVPELDRREAAAWDALGHAEAAAWWLARAERMEAVACVAVAHGSGTLCDCGGVSTPPLELRPATGERDRAMLDLLGLVAEGTATWTCPRTCAPTRRSIEPLPLARVSSVTSPDDLEQVDELLSSTRDRDSAVALRAMLAPAMQHCFRDGLRPGPPASGAFVWWGEWVPFPNDGAMGREFDRACVQRSLPLPTQAMPLAATVDGLESGAVRAQSWSLLDEAGPRATGTARSRR